MPDKLTLREIADAARVLYTAYPEAAADFAKTAEALRAARATRSPFPSDLEADLVSACQAHSGRCLAWSRKLADLAITVAEQLPAVRPKLRLVGNGTRWYEISDFDWGAGIAELCRIEAAAMAEEAAPATDDSAWVPAVTLWSGRIPTRRERDKFRQKHPDMFRSPSRFKLEIHAGLWATYWANRDETGFNSLGEEPPSIADDPTLQDDVLAGAARRMTEIRVKKRGEQP